MLTTIKQLATAAFREHCRTAPLDLVIEYADVDRGIAADDADWIRPAYKGCETFGRSEPRPRQAGFNVLYTEDWGCPQLPERIVMERFGDWDVVALPGVAEEIEGAGWLVRFDVEVQS
jgi:hypothetical protein